MTISAAQRQSLGIVSERVVKSDREAIERLPAMVTAPASQIRMVAAPATGLVEQVLVTAGDRVRRGQTLARFISPQLAELQRDELAAEIQANLAATALARDERLFREGIIPESRLQTTRTNHAQALAQLAERHAALRIAGLAEAHQPGAITGTATLTAPIDGYVLESLAVPGQRVEVATALFKLCECVQLALEIQLPAALVASVREGMTVRLADGNARGRILAVSRQVGASQTAIVRASVTHGTEKLRPGQAVEAVIDIPTEARQFQVPKAAVVRRGEKAYVFVERGEGFAPLAVEVTGTADELALVVGALSERDRVAVRGVAALKAAWLGIGRE